jgi:hypothetical protein
LTLFHLNYFETAADVTDNKVRSHYFLTMAVSKFLWHQS